MAVDFAPFLEGPAPAAENSSPRLLTIDTVADDIAVRIDAAGGWRDGADIAAAGLLDLADWPTRMRVIVRRWRSCGAARPATPGL